MLSPYTYILAITSTNKQQTLTSPPLHFSTCELGVSGASLLGTGVTFCALVFFTNDFFPAVLGVALGLGAPFVFAAEASVSVVGLPSVWLCFFSTGSPLVVGVLEKNPNIELWFLLEEAALPCFFSAAVGREGVVVSVFAIGRAESA